MKTRPNQKTLSALIVNHNGGQEILNCLAALYSQTARIEEIVVVDNASTDDSPARIAARFPEVKIILLEDNLNLSKAHNIGLQETSSDLVLILDDDVYVDSECIQLMFEAQLEHAAAIVCPRILLYPENRIVQCDGATPHFVGTMRLRHAYQPLETLPENTAAVFACIGACRLVARNLIIESGGFDESYAFYFEDLELSLRMRSLGHEIICAPKALVYHDRGSGTPQLSFRGQEVYPQRRFFINVRQRIITIFTHYEMRSIILLSPAILLYEAASLFLALQRGWIKVYLSAIASIFRALNHIVSRRRFLIQNRTRSDRQLFTGGVLPMAPGFLNRPGNRKLVDFFSNVLNFYWRLIARFIR